MDEVSTKKLLADLIIQRNALNKMIIKLNESTYSLPNFNELSNDEINKIDVYIIDFINSVFNMIKSNPEKNKTYTFYSDFFECDMLQQRKYIQSINKIYPLILHNGTLDIHMEILFSTRGDINCCRLKFMYIL